MKPLAIAALALLNERPMHPYEMVQVLTERHQDRIVKVRIGSVYHVVERLAQSGLVEATGTEREGNRPERTTYAMTAAGRRELTAWISALLREPVNEYPAFLVALSQAHELDQATVVALLRERDAHLSALIDDVTAVVAEAQDQGTDEAYWVTADYLRAQLITERDWLRRLADRIESKDLPWPKQ
jgi:DNA-binding PadR family transcriptional regulator